jgi:hypothetical protein
MVVTRREDGGGTGNVRAETRNKPLALRPAKRRDARAEPHSRQTESLRSQTVIFADTPRVPDEFLEPIANARGACRSPRVGLAH